MMLKNFRMLTSYTSPMMELLRPMIALSGVLMSCETVAVSNSKKWFSNFSLSN